MRPKIRYVAGIPHWFSWAVHYASVRRCRKRGHLGGGYICVHCGQSLGPLSEMDDPNAKVDADERRLARGWWPDDQ